MISKIKRNIKNLLSEFQNSWKKRKQSSNSQSKNDTIYNLISFCYNCIVSTFLIVLLLFTFFVIIFPFISNKKVDINLTYTSIGLVIAIAALLLGFLFVYDRIKDKISKEINAFETNLLHDEANPLQKQIKNLEADNDTNIKKNQELYYLACLFITNGENNEEKNQIILDRVKNEVCRDKYKLYSHKQIKDDLAKIYADRNSNTNLRAAITTINDKSWRALAASAARKSLGIKRDDYQQLKNDKNYLLFLDIYVFLSVWLVSSIDNNVATAMPYMPVKSIRLNYTTEVEVSPDIDAYERAFSYLAKRFDDGSFVKVVDEIQIFTVEQVNTFKKISIYLNQLIKMLQELNQHSQTK